MARKTKKAELPRRTEIEDLLARAARGDAAILPELRKLLDTTPALWRAASDLGEHARQSMIGLVAGNDLLVKESLERKLAEMQSEIADPAASPLEELLAERIIISWVQAGHADAMLAQAHDVDLKQATFLQRRVDQAHGRVLAAVKQLAVVRRLLSKEPKSKASKSAEASGQRADVNART